MSALHSNWKLRSANCVSLLTALFLTACSTPSTLPSPDKSLVTVACPELTPLTKGHLTDVARKLDQIAGQYNVCRTAALKQ